MHNWLSYLMLCVAWLILFIILVYYTYKIIYQGKDKNYKIKLFLLIIDDELSSKDLGFTDNEQKIIDNSFSETPELREYRHYFKIIVSVVVISFSSTLVLLCPSKNMQYFEIFFTLLSAICSAFNYVFLRSKSKFFITPIVMFYTFSQLFLLIHKLGTSISFIVFFISLASYLIIPIFSAKKLTTFQKK